MSKDEWVCPDCSGNIDYDHSDCCCITNLELKEIKEDVKKRVRLDTINRIINKHRDKAVITCEESCWCWELEKELLNDE